MEQNLVTARLEDNRETKTTSSRQARFLRPASWFSILLLALAVVSGAEQDRKLIKKVDPEYPPIARRLSLQGTVRVEITITPEGNVKSVVPLGGNPVLSQAVEEAVKQWKYASGPAETKKTLEFKF